MGLPFEPWISAVLESESMSESSVNVSGLQFYVPDALDGDAQTAYERLEGSGNAFCVSVVPPSRDGAYALTPGGEQLLADLDLSELGRVERDLKKHRNTS